MLTTAANPIPARLLAALDLDETVVAHLRGLLDSGLAVTGRRLFAWRGAGLGAPLPITAIDRVLVDTGSGSDQLAVVILPRQAVHPAVVLTRRANELVTTLAFIGDLVAAVGREPVVEHLGSVQRYSFAEPADLR